MAYNYEPLVTVEQISDEIRTEYEDAICGYVLKSCKRIGINVNKDGLIEALNNDRHKYDMGYRNGLEDGIKQGEEYAKRKYRWHDILVNKPDLPDEDGNYFTLHRTVKTPDIELDGDNDPLFKKVLPSVRYYSAKEGWDIPFYLEVVAWREIVLPWELQDYDGGEK